METATFADDTVCRFADSITVDGIVPTPRQFERADLLAMATVNTGPTTILCYTGRHVRDAGALRGVPLTALLDAAGLQTLPRSTCKQLVIAARAGDGYVCLFTWHELYNTPTGAGALVLVEQDGELLPPKSGGLQLISLNDLRLGPRQAMAVERISVNVWKG